MVFYGMRHPATKKYYRFVNRAAIADVELGGPNFSMISLFGNLKTLTEFAETHNRGKFPHEVVEMELREVRIIPPIIDVQPNEIPGNKLSVVG